MALLKPYNFNKLEITCYQRGWCLSPEPLLHFAMVLFYILMTSSGMTQRGWRHYVPELKKER